MNKFQKLFLLVSTAVAVCTSVTSASSKPIQVESAATERPRGNEILSRQSILAKMAFLDNRDWDWYQRNVPFLETPDSEIDATYYYRFDMMTKHFVYGSPEHGYSVTEFIDRPSWSGTYGAIVAPAGLQFADMRWLRDQRVTRDYARYWFHTPGAQPRAYSNWFGASMWGLYEAWGDRNFIQSMLPDMKAQYEGWEQEHFDPKAQMFVWNGMQDGMETNINSRLTKDWFRGAEGYRPTLNAYMYGDALAISRAAALTGDTTTAKAYADKAASLRDLVQKRLWDPKRKHFFHMFANDEDGGIKANTLTYQSGPHAGDPHGRELIGFVPWQFNLPDPEAKEDFSAAWKTIMDPDGFFAPYGPTTVERHDPQFKITPRCCVWSGDSWPYATSQTLEAMANLLNNYGQSYVNKTDYVKLLKVFSATQRHEGQPYIAEAANPDTGAWQIVDGHSEHYFHSSYVDLVVTGLAGLRPRADNILEVNPLIPDDWAYFALDDIAYHGHDVSVIWDRDGTRYNRGKGLTLIVDGQTAGKAPTLQKLEVALPAPVPAPVPDDSINFAVNNEGTYFPNFTASFSDPKTALQRLNDGVAWYLDAPPNRWTTEGSPNKSDSLVLNFGIERPVNSLNLYFLDDGARLKAPQSYDVEYWKNGQWVKVAKADRAPKAPQGHKPNIIRFDTPVSAERFRFTFVHSPGAFTGLSEVEAWGHAPLPLSAPTAKIDDLAYNPGDQAYPKASASYTSPFDKIEEVNDGKVFFSSNSRNRWTAFESPNETDWVQIDFGAEKTVGRVDMYIFGDGAGVRSPLGYSLIYWNGSEWTPMDIVSRTPTQPTQGMVNSVQVKPVKASKIGVTFKHDSLGRTGLTELMAFEK
ncbi:MGH1-like glycoside hydrolase domain-containing protein [Asticcacaulis sp.]|uniref:MGH1-like glycoside hydrolase domain-containing protein n=1 Tax=Asticcacaulis sp. TaxID=1872648 RepID=UPI002CEB1D58|nr:discoidin domain-containing protein [Asticcacaulis sp.]HTM79939.1 discoidin domain-containing protein [Asticcacaulis sp.]